MIVDIKHTLLESNITPKQVFHRIKTGESFVLNITSDWCSDCTVKQQPNLEEFECKLKLLGINLYKIVVQHERSVFLSSEHEKLTTYFGGHGYPRTSIIKNNNILYSRVEATTENDLDEFTKAIIKNYL